MSRFNLDKFASETDRASRGLDKAAREVDQFTRSVAKASNDLSAVGEAARSAGSSAGSAASAGASASSSAAAPSGFSQMGSVASSIGARIQTALSTALTPFRRDVGLLESQFNRLAGTLTTQARRIDAAMKFTAYQKALRGISDYLAGNITLQSGFTAMLLDTYRAVRQVTNVLSSMGDVAKRPLDTIRRITFDAPVRGLKNMANGFGLVSGSANAAKSSVTSFGRDLLVALGVFGLAYKAVEFFRNGVKGAIDLNETMNATKVTFGAASGSVTAFADDMAAKFGMVKGETLNVANGFGDFAKASGQSAGDAAKFSVTMTKLAADLSSFKNISFDEAAQKISSGLAGQSEPLRKFGVLMTEDGIKAKVMAMGLASSTKEISEGAKVAARAAIIQEGLAMASGDLARTQGDAANQFRKAGGGLTNFAVSIGQVLMPAVKGGVNVFNDFLATIIEVFEASKPMVASWVSYATTAINSVGVVIRNFGDFWEIARLRAREFGANFIAVLNTLPGDVALIAGWIGRNWYALIKDGINLTITAFSNFGSYLKDLAISVLNWLENPMSEFQAPNWKPLTEGFVRESEKMPELIKPAWVSMQSEIDAIGSRIAAKEAKRAKDMAGAVGEAAKAAKSADAANPAKAAEAKFAGLAERGSKEAYSAILKGTTGAGSDPMDKVANGVKQGNQIQNQMLAELKKANSKTPIATFAM